MLKKWSTVLISAVLIVVLVCGSLLFHWISAKGDFSPLTEEEKEAIEEAHQTEFPGLWYEWFEENGGKRAPEGVYRYFGRYGDCIVMVRYGDGQNAVDTLQFPLNLPYKMRGLSRPVEYPVEADIYLYHTKPKRGDTVGLQAPITALYYLDMLDLKWLTDAQLEQLTNDLEAWVAEGNY